MEGTDLPPPAAPPGIGESGKLRSAIDLLNISKVLALIMGIVGFLIALWTGVDAALGYVFYVPYVIYWVITGIVNLLIYKQIPIFDTMVRGRRYTEAKDNMLVWAVLGVIFGFIVGLLLLLIMFMYLDELEHGSGIYQAPPPPQY